MEKNRKQTTWRWLLLQHAQIMLATEEKRLVTSEFFAWWHPSMIILDFHKHTSQNHSCPIIPMKTLQGLDMDQATENRRSKFGHARYREPKQKWEMARAHSIQTFSYTPTGNTSQPWAQHRSSMIGCSSSQEQVIDIKRTEVGLPHHITTKHYSTTEHWGDHFFHIYYVRPMAPTPNLINDLVQRFRGGWAPQQRRLCMPQTRWNEILLFEKNRFSLRRYCGTRFQGTWGSQQRRILWKRSLIKIGGGLMQMWKNHW